VFFISRFRGSRSSLFRHASPPHPPPYRDWIEMREIYIPSWRYLWWSWSYEVVKVVVNQFSSIVKSMCGPKRARVELVQGHTWAIVYLTSKFNCPLNLLRSNFYWYKEDFPHVLKITYCSSIVQCPPWTGNILSRDCILLRTHELTSP